jgi:hypothetical protein
MRLLIFSRAGRHRHGHPDASLQAHAAVKIVQIDARIDDLQVIRASLVTAMEAGCDDRMACATSDSRPLPFTDSARLPAATQDTAAVV